MQLITNKNHNYKSKMFKKVNNKRVSHNNLKNNKSKVIMSK